MQTTIFSGRLTSRVGLGCGRLTGGASLNESRRIVERARGLGISHFDVAPSYGLGTAEDVLGEVLFCDDDVTIATKVGIARPSGAPAKTLARKILRPLLSSAPKLKARLAARTTGSFERRLFNPLDMQRSLTESLCRLRRSKIDALMLHEPEPDDLTSILACTMEQFVTEGQVGTIGSGSNGRQCNLVPFGTISQFRFDIDQPVVMSGTVVLHGALRHYRPPSVFSGPQRDELRKLGRDPADPTTGIGCLLTLALAENPTAIVLISSNSPDRLEQAYSAIDWSIIENSDVGVIEFLRSMFV